MSIITIVGAGMMGSALSRPARDNGHEVRLVGTHLDEAIIERAREDGYHITLKRRLPEGVKYYQFADLDEALRGADAVIGGVSSFGVEWFAENVLPRIPEGTPLLSVTKGLHVEDDGTLVAFPEILRRALPEGRAISLNAIGGPCTSYELFDRHQTEVGFCGRDMETLRFLKGLMANNYYHVSLTTDVIGLECAVALKNAYALAVTLAVGMYERDGGVPAYNAQAALFLQSSREMGKLIALAGGGADMLPFGVGDLYVTIFGGRTRKIGTLLGEGMNIDEALAKLSGVTLESVVIAKRTVRALRLLAGRGLTNIDDFPLLSHIGAVINDGSRVDIPWDEFA